MKALKIIGVILGFLAFAGFVFWFGWLRAPSPEDVCEHMAELVEKSTGVTMPEEDLKECIDDLQPPEFGKMPYAEQMKCMMHAETAEALDRC